MLIFEHLPRRTQASSERLDLEDLFKQGRTFQWSDLPERLWAATGLMLPNRQRYDDFGKLRNGIQHFASATVADASEESQHFIFEVIDPFIHDCWGLFAIDFDEDEERHLYLVGPLIQREILFLVSPEAAESFEHWDADWSKVDASYSAEMHRRVQEALKNKR